MKIQPVIVEYLKTKTYRLLPQMDTSVGSVVTGVVVGNVDVGMAVVVTSEYHRIND